MNSFFKAQFNYCHSVLMFYSHSLNNKVNSLHIQYLGIIYNNKHSNFEELLNKDSYVSIQYNNIHAITIEL